MHASHLRCATLVGFGLLVLGCTARGRRGVPPETTAHEVARPHVVLGLDAAKDGSPSLRFVLRGGNVFGVGKQNLLIDDGKVVAIDVADDAGERAVDVTGRFIVPGFIDSHVHLAYYPEGAAELASNGVVAVLDLAAPLDSLHVEHAPLRVLNAGPMITAPAGYPSNSWGANGYGFAVTTPAAGAAAVDMLLKAGVVAIKVPLTAAPTLDDATVKAVVDAAHAHGLKVYTHALEDENAARAGKDGVDVLAHTPTQALSDATLAVWQTRTVISTLSAFGGGDAAIANLQALRKGGARVLYGTDFGNTRVPGVQPAEITCLVAAGLDGASIVRAGTSVPAEFLGLMDLGSLTVGKRASFLVLAADPTSDPQTLTQPIAVYVDGALMSAGL